MNSKTFGTLIVNLATATALAFTAAADAATPPAHQHEPGAAVPALKLNAGRKWATDEALRQGMLKIKAAIDPRLPAVHAGKLSTAQYDALGREVETQLAYIVQNCKLEPGADAALHVILGEVTEGNDAVRGKNRKLKRSAGVVRLVRSLEDYGNYFDHPGWQAPRAEH